MASIRKIMTFKKSFFNLLFYSATIQKAGFTVKTPVYTAQIPHAFANHLARV